MHNFLPFLLLSFIPGEGKTAKKIFKENSEDLPELEGISSRQNGLHCPLAQLVGVVL
jgi:hypothetical protein